MPKPAAPASLQNRWVQLAIMVLSMVTLSNMQYGWTLFVNPMRNETHWATVGIQLAFSILIFLNTWLAPLEGWVADRYGPRFVVMLGGLAAGTSWVMNSRAHSLQALYVAAAVGGLGIGCVFGTSHGDGAQVVPRKTRIRIRYDRGRLWSGRGDHRDSHVPDDPGERFPPHVFLFRTAPGSVDILPGSVFDQAGHAGRPASGNGEGSPGAGVHSVPDGADEGVLAHLPGLPDDRFRGHDRDRAAWPYRARFRRG